MRNSDSLGQQMAGEDQNATKPAILLKQVRKEYRLYDSMADQALDVLGMSWLRFWRPIRYRTFAALDGIDLTIGHGERVGIIGRNGAGKTTLLKLITRNFAPTSGEISIDGQVQALMQTGLGFHGEFTGLENIRAGLIYNGLVGDDLEAAIEDVIDFCELGDFLNQPVKTYSLGMRARLQFATATAIKPDIVIIDEVLGAGDAYFAGKSNERITRLTGQGATLLIVSHSMAQILQFSDRAIWIDKGKTIAHGQSLDIVNRYEEHVQKLDDAHKRDVAGKRNLDSSELTEIPEWILEKNVAKNQGADWGGNGPLQIKELGLLDESGKVSTTIRSGARFGLFADISSEEVGAFQCSCVFVVYDEQGSVVTRIVEPETSYEFGANMHRIIAWIDDSILGKGKYVVSGGLFRGYRLEAPAAAYRYHILSRGFTFRIMSDRPDNCRVYLKSNWQRYPAPTKLQQLEAHK
jgi:lipopolysaccharide transport system ATP-binding protein